MSTMIYEIYDALKDAGASEEKARAAAEALTSYNERFNSIDTKLAVIEPEIKMLKLLNSAIGIGVLSLLIKAYFFGHSVG